MTAMVKPLISVFAYIFLAPFAGAILAGIDRKISGENGMDYLLR